MHQSKVKLKQSQITFDTHWKLLYFVKTGESKKKKAPAKQFTTLLKMVCFIINQISQEDMSQVDIFSFHIGMLDETILRCELEHISEINEPKFP